MSLKTLLASLVFSLFLALPLHAQWIVQNSNVSTRIWAIEAVDENHVWAATENGTVLRTEDGGDTWVPIVIPEAAEFTFYSIDAISEDTAYFLGAAFGSLGGSVYGTTDGGQSWELKFENDELKFNSLAFWNSANGMIVGSSLTDGYPHVYVTVDGGDTWTKTDEENIPPLLSGEFPGFIDGDGNSLTVEGDSIAWFGTAYGVFSEDPIRVFRSTDKGQTWTAVNTPLNTEGEFHGIGSIVFHDAVVGYAAGGGTAQSTTNFLAKTIDGGLTWNIVPSFPSKTLGMSEVSSGDSLGIVVNSFDGTFYSANGGADWSQIGEETRLCISFASPTAGWSGFLNGLIVKYDGPPLLTSTEQHVAEAYAPATIKSIQPNPFVSSTTIQFSLAQRSPVRLEILNAAGQVVAVPLQETLLAGIHQVEFSGTDLKGGIYICRLKAGGVSTVRKMVVTK